MQFDSHPYISRFLDRFSPETRSEVIKSLLFIGIDYVSNFYTDTHEILSLLRRISSINS